MAEFLQQGKRGNDIKTDFGNMQHRPTTWDRQTEAYTYVITEHDHEGQKQYARYLKKRI